MLAITPYTQLSYKIDSLAALIESDISVQKIQSAKIDSVREMTARLADGQESICADMDYIQSQLQQITDYGTGYSNAVAIIAIPLIIALFAFAFTYLFSVITRINEKYNSEHISGMFKTSIPYRCYMLGSAISVGYIILIGALSLILRGEAREVFMVVMNWTSLFVAGGYAAIILWFVHTCLNYDDHQKIQDTLREHLSVHNIELRGHRASTSHGQMSLQAIILPQAAAMCKDYFLPC